MTFWQKIKMGLARFMEGRHGADNLGMFTLISGLVISLLSSFTGIPLLSFVGLAQILPVRQAYEEPEGLQVFQMPQLQSAFAAEAGLRRKGDHLRPLSAQV